MFDLLFLKPIRSAQLDWNTGAQNWQHGGAKIFLG
jgi:hypothetical protein